jgi:hypothetical protein
MQVNQKNWQELIRPSKLDVQPGRDRRRVATFVAEPLASLDEAGLYPVNALRNRALQLARTDVLLLLDADFIPNQAMGADVTDPGLYEVLHRATAARQALVLPAFETVTETVEEGRRAALRAAGNKEAARQMMRAGRLQAFHSDHFESGPVASSRMARRRAGSNKGLSVIGWL